MKVSELLNLCQQCLDEQGDGEVNIATTDEFGEDYYADVTSAHWSKYFIGMILEHS